MRLACCGITQRRPGDLRYAMAATPRKAHRTRPRGGLRLHHQPNYPMYQYHSAMKGSPSVTLLRSHLLALAARLVLIDEDLNLGFPGAE